MTIAARVLADSVAPCGMRLTTLLCRYPRSIHAEIMTHRETSKNSASSRAIPTARLIELIEADPFVPTYIGTNQRGMQAGEELHEDVREKAVGLWRENLNRSLDTARAMLGLGVHKQVVNRVVEVGMHIEIILSSTSWTNWDGLRDHTAAEPHFQELARAIKAARAASVPKTLTSGEWHMPLVHDEDWPALGALVAQTEPLPDGPAEHLRRMQALAVKVSVGRCARVSYLTHEGKRDIAEDIKLHDKMVVQEPLHASPAEHVAQAMDWPRWWRKRWPARLPTEVQDMVVQYLREEHDFDEPLPSTITDGVAVLAQLRSGNFLGWRQYRKTMKNEYIGGLRP